MTERLELCAVFSSSEEKHFPASETARQGHMVSRGWHSAPNCNYPQVIGFRFAFGEVHIDRIQVLSNDWKVPSRVEVHVAPPESINLCDGPHGERVPVPFHAALFRNCGYFTFRNEKQISNSDRGEQEAASQHYNSTFSAPRRSSTCGELKVVQLGVPALYVKLVCHEPHAHPLNVFQQVGIISVVSLGKPQRLVLPSPSAAHLVGAAGSTSHEAAVVRYLRGGAQRDVSSDQQVLDKMQELEQAKVRTISLEDYESARRIRDQLVELIPLGTALNDLEHRKRKSIAEEDYNEAHRLKQVITRIRAYVGGLQPGMPYQRLDLASVVNASLHEVQTGQDLNPTPSRRTLLPEVSSPHRSFVKHNQVFDEIPVGSQGRTSISPIPAQSDAASPLGDEEGPLLIKDVGEAERPLAEEIRRYLPQGSDNLHPEHVGDSRAAEINGWKKLNSALGYYLCCCLYSRKFQLREAGFEFVRHIIHGQRVDSTAPETPQEDSGEGDSDVVILRRLGEKMIVSKKMKPHEIAMLLLFLLATPGGGVADAIQSVLFPACDICQELFRDGNCLKAQTHDTALLGDLVNQIIRALVSRLGDSNTRVRTVVEETVLVLVRSQQPFAGAESVAKVILKTKPKFAKHAQESVKLLTQIFQHVSSGQIPALLNIQNVFQTFLKPLVTHANPGVRDASIALLAMYAAHCTEADKDVRSVLSSLKPAQVKLVREKLPKSSLVSNRDGALEPSNQSKPGVSTLDVSDSTSGQTTSVKRRTIEDTKQLFPDAADIYHFKASPMTVEKGRRLKLQGGHVQGGTAHDTVVTSVSTPQKPSVLKRRLADATATDAALINATPLWSTSPSSHMLRSSSSMSPGSKSLDSAKYASPKRRHPPSPTPGRCQFCGEADESFVDQENLVAHFFSDCPMLCTCPLCKLPVEIREVHWHLSEDCEHKNTVRRCPQCFECVRSEEYDAHIDQATCIQYVPAQLACPLCHEQLLADDIFWEAHILYPPFCPQNPRTQFDADDPDEIANSDHSSATEHPEHAPV